MLMADAVSKLAAKTPGKEAVAMEAFAKALREVKLSVQSVVCLARLEHNVKNSTNFHLRCKMVVF